MHGVTTIIFGVPHVMLVVLVAVLSVYALVDGRFAAVAAERGALGDAARDLPVR